MNINDLSVFMNIYEYVPLNIKVIRISTGKHDRSFMNIHKIDTFITINEIFMNINELLFSLHSMCSITKVMGYSD